MSRRSAGLVAVSILPLLAACNGAFVDWRTDMWYQPSHRAEDSPRPEPEHSIPLGAGPRVADRDDAERLVNPLENDAASLRHGRALFAARCSFCHGAEGHGGGAVSKYFPPAPDLAYATIKERSDGYLFGTITFGGRAMPAQAEGLTVRDRWDLVNAVRAIQGRGAGVVR
ncbi:MAG: cytochrome c [Acidobacteriia bacterium]|jgi:mono/diheme cytochrome c family protein|nr:cytochrome c [Terriglobia bacterium]